VLVQEKGLMFVAMSEMKIATRLDSYITNVSIMKRDFFLIVYDAAIRSNWSRMNKMRTRTGNSASYGSKATQSKRAVCTGHPLRTHSMLGSTTAQSRDSRLIRRDTLLR